MFILYKFWNISCCCLFISYSKRHNKLALTNMDPNLFKTFLDQQAAQAKMQADQQAKQMDLMIKMLAKLDGKEGEVEIPGIISGVKEQLMASLSTRIEMFNYAPDEDQTFDKWYGRYAELIVKDGEQLPDDAKVRLIISKLGGSEFRKVEDAKKPKGPYEGTYTETVALLQKLFASTRSLVARRYECFKLAQTGIQDFVSYGAQVNAAWEIAQASDITGDTLKCLSFVSGLKVESHDLRTRCIQVWELAERSGKEVKLDDLVEECKNHMMLKDSVDRLSRNMEVSINTTVARTQDAKRKKGNYVQHASKEKNVHRKYSSSSGSISGNSAYSKHGLCSGCGSPSHRREKCWHKHAVCHKCGQKGHISRVCRSKKDRSSQQIENNQAFVGVVSFSDINEHISDVSSTAANSSLVKSIHSGLEAPTKKGKKKKAGHRKTLKFDSCVAQFRRDDKEVKYTRQQQGSKTSSLVIYNTAKSMVNDNVQDRLQMPVVCYKMKPLVEKSPISSFFDQRWCFDCKKWH